MLDKLLFYIPLNTAQFPFHHHTSKHATIAQRFLLPIYPFLRRLFFQHVRTGNVSSLETMLLNMIAKQDILLPISYAPSSINQFLSIANNPPAIAGVAKVEVGSRSLRAMSFGGNHSQKKFKRQLNPPRRYVDTGSNWKPKFWKQYVS